jgi:hypothetical protein
VEGFSVRDGFPRITRGTVPMGVVAVAYNLDPAAAADFRLADGELATIFASFASGG